MLRSAWGPTTEVVPSVRPRKAPSGRRPLPAEGIMELDNLGPVESFTLTITRLPGGKFSVRSGTSTIETLNSGRSGARAPNSGRIDPCLRRRKVLDPEDQQPHWDLGGEATDELWCNDVTRARRYAVTRCYAVTRAECDAVTGARFERARRRTPTPDGLGQQ